MFLSKIEEALWSAVRWSIEIWLTTVAVVKKTSWEIIKISGRLASDFLVIIILVVTPALAALGTILFLAQQSLLSLGIAIFLGLVLVGSAIYVFMHPDGRVVARQKSRKERREETANASTDVIDKFAQFLGSSRTSISTKITLSLVYLYLMVCSLANYLELWNLPIFDNFALALLRKMHHLIFDTILISGFAHVIDASVSLYNWASGGSIPTVFDTIPGGFFVVVVGMALIIGLIFLVVMISEYNSRS